MAGTPPNDRLELCKEAQEAVALFGGCWGLILTAELSLLWGGVSSEQGASAVRKPSLACRQDD